MKTFNSKTDVHVMYNIIAERMGVKVKSGRQLSFKWRNKIKNPTNKQCKLTAKINSNKFGRTYAKVLSFL